MEAVAEEVWATSRLTVQGLSSLNHYRAWKNAEGHLTECRHNLYSCDRRKKRSQWNSSSKNWETLVLRRMYRIKVIRNWLQILIWYRWKNLWPIKPTLRVSLFIRLLGKPKDLPTSINFLMKRQLRTPAVFLPLDRMKSIIQRRACLAYSGLKWYKGAIEVLWKTSHIDLISITMKWDSHLKMLKNRLE